MTDINQNKHYIKLKDDPDKEQMRGNILNIEATFTHEVEQKKRGRPFGSVKQNKDVQIWTRLTPEDYQKLIEQAEKEGHSPSSLARKFILDGLKKCS